MISISYLAPFLRNQFYLLLTTLVHFVVSFSVLALPDLAQTQSVNCRTTMSAQDQEVAATLYSSMKVVSPGVVLIE